MLLCIGTTNHIDFVDSAVELRFLVGCALMRLNFWTFATTMIVIDSFLLACFLTYGKRVA